MLVQLEFDRLEEFERDKQLADANLGAVEDGRVVVYLEQVAEP